MQKKVYKRHIDNFEKHWWFQERKKLIENVIKFNLKKKKLKILDFGAGSGVNIQMLAQFGVVDIYEPHKETKIFLKKKYSKKNFLILNSVGNKKYDLIILADVLEHVKNDKNQIKKLSSNLKDNGIILITVPAFQFLFTSKDKILGHFRRYTPSKIKKIFSNFKIIKLSFFNFFLFFPISIALVFFKILNKNFIDQVEKKPNEIINFFFYFIFLIESKMINLVNFPIGISILGIFQKK